MPADIHPQMWLGTAVLASVPIYLVLQSVLAFSGEADGGSLRWLR